MAINFPTINLVFEKRRLRKQKASRRDRLVRISTISLIVYIGLLVPIVVTRFALSARLNSVESEIDKNLAAIEANSSIETKYVLVSKKLGLIANLLPNRRIVQNSLTRAYDLFPSGVGVSDVAFGESGGPFSLSGESDDVFVFSQLVDALDRSVQSGEYVKIEMGSVRRSDDGSYKFALDFTPSNGTN